MTIGYRHHNFLTIFLAVILGTLVGSPAQTLPTNVVTPSYSATVKQQSQVIIEFRGQKPGTEGKFVAQNQLLQILLAEQKKLELKGDRRAIRKHKAKIERAYRDISSFFEPATIDDRDIVRASVELYGQSSNVSIAFTEKGGQKFARITKSLAGTGRSIGIFQRGKLISAPTISPQFSKRGITGGQAVIEGNFTAKEARDLADRINQKASLTPVGKSQSLVESGTKQADRKDFAAAISNFDEAIKLDSRNSRAYLARGKAQASLKKWQEAIQDYQQALKIEPDNIYVYFLTAKAKEALKDYEGAMIAYEKIQEISPDSANHYSPLLKVYILLGKKQKALDLVDRIAGEDRHFKSVFRGIILTEFQDYKTAIANFDTAIALKPKDPGLYLYRGIAYQKLGDRQAAIKDWQKVVSIKPEDTIPQELRTNSFPIGEDLEKMFLKIAYFIRGTAYYHLEDWQAAKQDLDRAIAIDSNNPNVYHQRSLVRQKLKDEVGAKQDADKATELFELSGEIALPF